MTLNIRRGAEAPVRRDEVDWIDAIIDVADSIERGDLDLHDVPMNRNVVGNPSAGRGLRRSSEYNPRKNPPPRFNVEIPRKSYARIHGEVRPTTRGDSIIANTCFDYVGAEATYHHINKRGKETRIKIPIDGFCAVTAPTLRFDKKFDKRDKSVTFIGKDGNLNYQNPLRTSKPLATPFESIIPPPPKTKEGENPDFMFYFVPIRETWLIGLAERYVNRKIGAFFLWAFLPTLGLTDEEIYRELGIRYNTMPRKFGDLLRLYRPLFEERTRTPLLRDAPFINPNNTYYIPPTRENKRIFGDKVGRLPIPDSSRALEHLNTLRNRAKLPPIGESRGPAIDWIGLDLANDPQRLKQTPRGRFPRGVLHARFKKDTVWDLPMGKIHVHPETDLRIHYRLRPVPFLRDGEKGVLPKIEIKVVFGPLHLEKTRLKLGENYSLEVGQALRARHVEINFALVKRKTASGEEKWQPDATGLKIKIEGLKGKAIKFDHPLVNFQARRLDIAELHLRASFDFKEVRLHIPTFNTEGSFSLKKPAAGSFDFSVREGAFKAEKGQLILEGDLSLNSREIRGIGTDVLRWKKFEVTPRLKDVSVNGQARLEYQRDGFRLARRPGKSTPLSVKFKLAGSRLTHVPNGPEDLEKRPSHAVIKTDVHIQEAQVLAENIKEVEYQRITVDGETRGRLQSLQSGPILIHHIRGNGRIWVDTGLWATLDGIFPYFGIPLSEQPPERNTPLPRGIGRPRASDLTEHFDANTRELLKDGEDFSNFIRMGGISIGQDGENPAATHTEIRDLVIFTHESGGYWQFGAVGIPELHLRQGIDREGKAFRNIKPEGDIYTHIFLKNPKRGHTHFELKPKKGQRYRPD